LLNEYQELNVKGGRAYIRSDSFEKIKSLDAIIFDCDGVLIDARRSYDEAIRRTVQHIFTTLTHSLLPLSTIPKEAIYNLRLSGGFNFDWDTTYVIALVLFKNLPKPFQEAFSEAAKQIDREEALERLTEASSRLNNKLPKDYFEKNGKMLKEALIRFTQSNPEDREAAEGLILKSAERESCVEHLKDFIEFLAYNSEAPHNMISIIFDTYFYGPKLFKELYGFESRLKVRKGLIEKEKLIVTEETLKALKEMLGEGRLGLATGRSSLATKKTLGDLLSYFNSRGMVFLEDLKYKMGGSESLIKPYVKPQPYSLLEAAAGIGDVNSVLYVGNSAEDYLMTKNANSVRRIFLFAGCYALHNTPSKMIELFKGAEAAVIIPTVNDLPKVLEYVRGVRGG
jgi:phosphoglycolate phosphatase-like HAD superfamily hydrolase